MTVPRLICRPAFKEANLGSHSHVLFVIALVDELPALPNRAYWQMVLERRQLKAGELAKAPLTLDLPNGVRASCLMVDPAQSRFERLTALRKAVMALLDEFPEELALVISGPFGDLAEDIGRDAVYVAALNGYRLPVSKKKPAKSLQSIYLYGSGTPPAMAPALVLARANTLARELTAMPPNVLTPLEYRRRLRTMARLHGWRIEEFGFGKLQRMGAGAFCAVAQGSGNGRDGGDAAIVHLSWQPRRARHRVALVGKGICFDTGGHNLKPARYMVGMHEDMNGSAVAVALLRAVQELRLPVALDVWLAIAHNHLSPEAYKQGDVVTALNGTTIEVVHTDAEGRMVLADTLALAARAKPDLTIDFATLTGSMATALGSRYSGVFASDEGLAQRAVRAGHAAGERVCLFPLDADYEDALDSKVADIKQCTMAGEADHILAARFLRRFAGEGPWLHVDISASSCEGGLGAVGTDLTGFGVAWGATLLADWVGIQ